MTNTINETINPKESVLFIYGNLSEVAGQFAEMLKYCKKKKLHVADIFFDTSNISVYQRECFNQMLDYLKHNNNTTKQAVVFYSRKEFNKFSLTHELAPLEKKIKLNYILSFSLKELVRQK